ncbi:MAG: mandelate racemase/muconate lactonizing enzyme family protein, partial [candidate division NC10 bacterium]|nr:mandelate racemase/muconate lactonizing enzyme family protein [candidate division NC10 bacterium]
MKITDVEATVLVAKLPEPWQIAGTIFRHSYMTLVRIRSDAGFTGYGECIVRHGPGATKAIVEEVLRPILVGKDPFEIEGRWDEMFMMLRNRGHHSGFFLEAMAGVDIALWDLMGKALNLPVHQLMGGFGRAHLPAYASSLLFKDLAALEKEAETLMAQGFKAVKLKVGKGLPEDIRNVKAIRKIIGEDVKLMVDANGAFDAATAVEVGKGLEDHGVYWFEEPVPPDDLPGYAALKRALTIRIAGGESLFSRFDFRDFIERRLLDVVQPDIARAGGFTECRKIAAMASASHIPYAPHTGASGALCVIASLHL